MKAAVLVRPGHLEMTEVADPPCPPGGVVVKVAASLVCSTDLHMWRSGHPALRYPRVLGHEIAGEIAQASPGVAHPRVGDRVQVYPGISCGRCSFCRRGRENLCRSMEILGFTAEGGFAQYLAIPARSISLGVLTPVPDQLPLVVAALAEPVACCVNGLDRVGLREGERVVVLGGGPVGCLFAMICRRLGAGRVIVVERNPARVRFAAALSVDTIASPAQGDLVEEVRDLTEGEGADLLVTCFREAPLRYPLLDLVAPGGKILCFSGLPKAEQEITLDLNRIHYGELTVAGAYGCTSAQCRRAIELLSKDLEASWLISHRVGLSDLVEGLELVASERAMKVCVKPWEDSDVESCLVR